MVIYELDIDLPWWSFGQHIPKSSPYVIHLKRMLYQLYPKKKKKKNTNFYMLVTLLSSPTLLQYLILTTLESDSYYYLRTEKQRIRNFKNLLKIKLVVNKGIHLARLSSIGSTLLNYSTMGPPLSTLQVFFFTLHWRQNKLHVFNNNASQMDNFVMS